MIPAAPSAVIIICSYTNGEGCVEYKLKNDTHLVIPAVCTGPDLDATLEVIRTAEEVVAEFGEVVRCCVIEAHNEECIVDNLEA